jgi:hypothetical protein
LEVLKWLSVQREDVDVLTLEVRATGAAAKKMLAALWVGAANLTRSERP